jgi:hypothetical protein
MTVDPNCDEIKSQLLEGQTAYDCPAIVCRVFHAKKEALLHNLKNGKYFGSKTAYIINVTEYQHRGLPHVHIVYRLENGPDHNNLDECISFIEKYLCSSLPIIDENSSQEDIDHHNLGSSHQMHQCRRGCNGCLDENGICKKKYGNRPVNQTSFDKLKYPIYKRPRIEDCYVVVHNRQMLLDCKCHVNTKFCASSYCVIYLYKYLFKGKK